MRQVELNGTYRERLASSCERPIQGRGNERIARLILSQAPIYNERLIMASRLIQLSDHTLVEIEVPDTQARQISGGVAEKVDAALDKINPMLLRICRPIAEAWRDLNRDFQIEEANIELGLSFEMEGNVYITKSKAEANLTILLKMKLRP
jgi:hypothetical protein